MCFRTSLTVVFSLLRLFSIKRIIAWRNALIACLLVSTCLPVSGLADPLHVLVVLSDNTAPYLSFSRSFSQNLPTTILVSVQQRAEDFVDGAQNADVIVAVGAKASMLVASRSPAPMLAALLPRSSYEGLLARPHRSKSLSAIYLDQPWERQADLIHALLPDSRTVGLLYTTTARIDIASLSKAMARHDMVLNAQLLVAPQTLSVNLENLLKDSDVLLAIPDNAIYSSNNIRNILLTTYQKGVPLIGLSQSYVNAGALCAVFSTTEQIAAQASETIISFAQTHQLPDAQYSVLYTLAVNQEVARTLSVPYQSAEMLRLQMDNVKRKMR